MRGLSLAHTSSFVLVQRWESVAACTDAASEVGPTRSCNNVVQAAYIATFRIDQIMHASYI